MSLFWHRVRYEQGYESETKSNCPLSQRTSNKTNCMTTKVTRPSTDKLKTKRTEARTHLNRDSNMSDRS